MTTVLLSQPECPSGREPRSAYWAFYREVAACQLAAWLPSEPVRLLDLSDRPEVGAQAARAGHDVVHVAPTVPAAPGGHPGRPEGANPRAVVADPTYPSFLVEGTVDAVVAEQLSRCLATETAVAELAKVLRPGGRLLLRVDSLLLGMSQLAQQRCWAELSDAPSAEVLIVPYPDGSIKRCFWPEQLCEVLAEAGLEPEWVHPRTVLSPSVVQQALAEDPDALPELVQTELSLPEQRADEAVGIHLLASARRPASAAA